VYTNLFSKANGLLSCRWSRQAMTCSRGTFPELRGAADAGTGSALPDIPCVIVAGMKECEQKLSMQEVAA